jgi:hypothetical protein
MLCLKFQEILFIFILGATPRICETAQYEPGKARDDYVIL